MFTKTIKEHDLLSRALFDRIIPRNIKIIKNNKAVSNLHRAVYELYVLHPLLDAIHAYKFCLTPTQYTIEEPFARGHMFKKK